MKRLIPTLLVLIAFIACKEKTPYIQHHELIGIWDCIGDCEGDYEFYEEEGKYSFYLFSGQRMYDSGTWELHRNRITLNYSMRDTAIYPIQFRGDTLVFGKNEMLLVPAHMSSDEDEDCSLGYLPDGFLGIDFSNPQSEGFSWNYQTEDSSSEVAQIEGFSIETDVVLHGNYSPLADACHTIAEYLRTLGYESDMYNTSEIVSGYRKGNCVVLLWPERGGFDPEDDVDTEDNVDTKDDVDAVDDVDADPSGEMILKVLYGKLDK
ncbi:MAG TPA: hypothetical protein PKL52_04205 [Tenuifilaceae bacterium]|nr:hypothetical protein [Tenuifilaceae bacterium]